MRWLDDRRPAQEIHVAFLRGVKRTHQGTGHIKGALRDVTFEAAIVPGEAGSSDIGLFKCVKDRAERGIHREHFEHRRAGNPSDIDLIVEK